MKMSTPGMVEPKPPTRSEAREELEKRGLTNNKRNRKMIEREF
jgi:hypothetical protein